MRDKYGSWSDRVRDRAELSDLIAQMVSELSALHTFVAGGDMRTRAGPGPALPRSARGWRDDTAPAVIASSTSTSPIRTGPDRRSPLARPGVESPTATSLLSVNGRDVLSVADPRRAAAQPGRQAGAAARAAEGQERGRAT